MSTPVNPPELIISLFRDKVRLQLLEQPALGRAPWESAYPVQSTFMADQVSNAIDAALIQNSSLLDHFNQVEVVVIDRPNILVPQHYVRNGMLSDIAGKYLRVRIGDTLSADTTYGDTVIAYTVPTDTINVVREYYAKVSQLHLTSVLWNALQDGDSVSSKDISRLYFFLFGNTLIVLGDTSGKLSFSKNFYIQEQDDILYYCLACSRMLKPKEKWHVTIEQEESLFEMPVAPYLLIDYHRELATLHTMIARHRSCES